MTDFVLDASVAVAWFMPEQATPATERMLTEVDSHHLIAPAYYAYEIRHVLARAHRRKVLTEEEVATGLGIALSPQVRLAPDLGAAAKDDVLALALAIGLGFYDAVYFALAIETGFTLASRDERLLVTARRHGMPTYDARSPP